MFFTTQAKIGIALAVTVLAVFGLLWQIANIRGLKSRGRRRTAREGELKTGRKSDTRNLRGPEKRLYNESQKLLQQGKTAAAARILEQLNMPREAIQALEDQGMIHEAAKILMRMQRHNRAGVVYARHGMWENAASCFKMANMPLEVAKCAREAGDLTMAAEYFEKVGRFEDAGECFEQLGDFHRAARFFASAGQRQRSMGLYDSLITKAENISALKLEDDEIQQIIDYLGEGNTDKGLTAVATNRNKLTEVLINLVTKGLVKQAGEILQQSANDLGPMLMAEVNYQTRAAGCLAEVFLNISQHHYAGMVYERMSSFERAGECFEQAEDFDRAAYCYERAGVDFKVKQLKEKARTSQRAPSPRAGKGGFALSNIQTFNDNIASNDNSAAEDEEHDYDPRTAGGDEEHTNIVDMNKLQIPDIPPVPERIVERAAAEPPAIERTPVTPPPPRRTEPAPSFSLESADDVESSWPPATKSETGTSSTSEVASDEDVAPASLPPTSLQPEPIMLEEGRASFHKASFFADLDFEQKNKLWNIGTTLAFNADESVLTYNDEPKGVYVIVQGSVSCYRLLNGKEAYVDQMGESESFGELWLLADQPTAVRFVATKNTRVRVINRDTFNALLDKDGMLARKLYKRFTMRLLKRLLKPQNNPIRTSQAS